LGIEGALNLDATVAPFFRIADLFRQGDRRGGQMAIELVLQGLLCFGLVQLPQAEAYEESDEYDGCQSGQQAWSEAVFQGNCFLPGCAA
jgi:hypothetical protein